MSSEIPDEELSLEVRNKIKLSTVSILTICIVKGQ